MSAEKSTLTVVVTSRSMLDSNSGGRASLGADSLCAGVVEGQQFGPHKGGEAFDRLFGEISEDGVGVLG